MKMNVIWAMFVGIFVVGCAPKTPPHGIIAMTPALAECVWAVDPDYPVVGVSEFTKDERAKSLVKLQRNGSVERIVAMNPELVLLQTGDELMAEKLQKMEIQTLIFPMNSREDVENALLILGEKFNRLANARDQVQMIRNKMTENSNKYDKGERKNALLLIDRLDVSFHTFYMAEPSTFISQIAGGCGFNAIFYRGNEQAWSLISAEELIQMNPEYIIYFAHSYQDKIEVERALTATYPELDAIRNHHLFVYDDSEVTIPSPNMGMNQEKLCEFVAELRED